MKGYIDEYGRLFIWRKKEFKQTECREGHLSIPCDERCSRFGEPIASGADTLLELCTKTLKFTDFEDGRSI